MSVVIEAFEEPLAHVLVYERVEGDLLDPLLGLLGSRQLAMEQEIRDLEIGRLLCQLLDRIAAVLEDSVVAVHISDCAFG